MPWKETCAVEERLSFIARLRDGEAMSEVCREFGISRKTGYKLWKRFQDDGLAALRDRSRRPERQALQTEPKIEKLIVQAKERRPTWGAAKIRVLLGRDHPQLRFPSRTTVHAILDRHGLVKHKKRRLRRRMEGTTLEQTTSPNDLWCADYKGQFRLKNGSLCYPLTISDHVSRYLLACESLPGTKSRDAMPIFRGVFREFGLPKAIRTDNGPPFASSAALFGLTKLSAWWRSIGIVHERIEPGHPEQNGRHERIHLTMQKEVVPNAGENLLRQQDLLDIWRQDYNDCRPHESLAMQPPAEIYRPSEQSFSDDRPVLEYQGCKRVLRVFDCGTVWLPEVSQKIFVSQALAGQYVGLRDAEEGLYELLFTDLSLGYLDQHEGLFHRNDL